MTTYRIADLLIQALRDGSTDGFDRLAEVFSSDVEFASSQASPSSGLEAVVSQLQGLQSAGRFAKTLEWDEPRAENGGIRVRASQPASSQYSAYVWDLTLDGQARVERILQTGLGQTEPLPTSSIVLNDDIARGAEARSRDE